MSSDEDPVVYELHQVKAYLLVNGKLVKIMSTTTLEEHFDSQDNEENLGDLVPHGPILSEIKPNAEDLLCIHSGQPSPVKDVHPHGDNKDSKVMETIGSQSLTKSGILTHLQLASPLESVRELVEVEDACDLQIPEEPISTKKIFPTTTVRYMSLTTEGLGQALERAAILGPVMESTTQHDLALLESPMTEACSSIHEIPAGFWLQEDSSKISVTECQQVDKCLYAVGGVQKETEGHQLTPSSANSGVFEIQLNKHSSVPPLEDLLNPREEQMCHQTGAKVEAMVGDELRFDRKSNSERFRVHISEKEDTATSVANQSLIEVLTACKAKVEQYEQLRSSSFGLSAQLRSAQLMAASLHHRVLCLEQEQSLKEKELQELTINLEKTNEALEARNCEIATISNELHQLHLQVEAQKNVTTATGTITANGLSTADPQLQSGRSSKVCILL